MQGRLSPPVGDRIQAFPWENWQSEFPFGRQLGFRLIEWTLDQERLAENPLMNPPGQQQIRNLCRLHGIRIPALTGDCFMQAPFWKHEGATRLALQNDFLAVVRACSALPIPLLVVPLVDGGRLANRREQEVLLGFLQEQSRFFRDQRVRIALETDLPPLQAMSLFDTLDPESFGINYDIGNSAGLGYSYQDEFRCYGSRIFHVHVKDRPRGGSTVPLGEGDADLPGVFRGLADLGYQGDYILQTARATDGDHAGVLTRYRDMVVNWIGATYGSRA
jgi:hexulose-6-phosphate isomerase